MSAFQPPAPLSRRFDFVPRLSPRFPCTTRMIQTARTPPPSPPYPLLTRDPQHASPKHPSLRAPYQSDENAYERSAALQSHAWAVSQDVVDEGDDGMNSTLSHARWAALCFPSASQSELSLVIDLRALICAGVTEGTGVKNVMLRLRDMAHPTWLHYLTRMWSAHIEAKAACEKVGMQDASVATYMRTRATESGTSVLISLVGIFNTRKIAGAGMWQVNCMEGVASHVAWTNDLYACDEGTDGLCLARATALAVGWEGALDEGVRVCNDMIGKIEMGLNMAGTNVSDYEFVDAMQLVISGNLKYLREKKALQKV